jgi:hypothetical protein
MARYRPRARRFPLASVMVQVGVVMIAWETMPAAYAVLNQNLDPDVLMMQPPQN